MGWGVVLGWGQDSGLRALMIGWRRQAGVGEFRGGTGYVGSRLRENDGEEEAGDGSSHGSMWSWKTYWFEGRIGPSIS